MTTNNDGVCYWCKEQTDSLAGNPGLWPLVFAHPDRTGIPHYHHVKCVLKRIKFDE